MSGLPKPYTDVSCCLVDFTRAAHLARRFFYILLIDADGVGPQHLASGKTGEGSSDQRFDFGVGANSGLLHEWKESTGWASFPVVGYGDQLVTRYISGNGLEAESHHAIDVIKLQEPHVVDSRSRLDWVDHDPLLCLPE